jgi:hypothetical protein
MATLLPPPESDLAWLIDMAEFAELYAANQSSRHAAANTLGTALYRAGRYQEAANSVLNSIEYHGKGGELMDWLVLALAHYSMGNVVEARTWWEKSQQAVRDDPNLISPTVVGMKSYWWSRLENITIYREAMERLSSLTLVPPPPVYSTIAIPQ